MLGQVASSNIQLPELNPKCSIDVSAFEHEKIYDRHLTATSLGPHYDGAMLWYYDIRNNWNYLVAAVTRLCRQVPEFKAGADFEKFFEDFLDFYDIKGPIPIIPFEEYIVKHPSYTAKKKANLIKLHHETKNLSLDELWRYTAAASFIKWEPYTEEKKPRLINPRDDIYKVRVAHIHASVDKFLYEKLSGFLVKGMTTTERSAKIAEIFKDRDETTSSDFSSQEVSIKEFLMRLECRIYERLLTGCPEVNRETLNLIIVTKLSPQRLEGSGLKLVLDIARDSGDPDTASMNAVENILSTLFSYKTQLYPEMNNFEFFREKGLSYDLLCEGDDGIHASSRGVIDSSTYELLGFIAKIDTHSSYREASFCGQVLSSLGTLFASPIKFLLKLGWAHPQYHGSSMRTKNKLLVAKAYSALYLYPGCPVIHPIASRIVRRHIKLINENLKHLMFDDPFKIEQIKFSQETALQLCKMTIKNEDRYDYERMYGLSVQDQLSLEAEPMDKPWHNACLDKILPTEYFENFLNCARVAPVGYTEIANHDLA